MHSRSVTRVLQLVARLLPRTFNALVPCIIGYVVFRTLRAHQKAKVHSPSTSNYIWSNWEGSVTSVPGQVLYPASVEELRSIVIAANANLRKIKVFGGKHSWSAIARPDPGAIALSLDKLNKVLEFDEKKGEVFVEGGIRLKELHKQLFSRGYALPVLGSISEQSWSVDWCQAGVMSTATHGSGLGYGCLATLVSEFSLLLANGEILKASPKMNAELYWAAGVGLGALGIIITARIRVVPAFRLMQRSSRSNFADFIENLPRLLQKNDHIKYMLLPTADMLKVIEQSPVSATEVPDPSWLPVSSWRFWLHEYFATRYFFENVTHLQVMKLAYHLPDRFTKMLLKVVAPLMVRDNSPAIVDRSERVFNYLYVPLHSETEWCVPLERAQEVLKALMALHEQEGVVTSSMPIEVRFVRGDSFIMSPFYKRDSLSLTFMIFAPPERIKAYYDTLQRFFEKYEGRPHWGKIHHCSPSYLRSVYPHFDRFLALRQKLDPNGIFLNEHLRELFGIPQAASIVSRL